MNCVAPFTPREQQTIAAHGGLTIQLAPEEYLVAGRGLTVTFSADSGLVGHLRLPSHEYGVQRVRLHHYR